MFDGISWYNTCNIPASNTITVYYQNNQSIFFDYVYIKKIIFHQKDKIKKKHGI